jgi:arabinan endo-1,5-alpha-L-arabinosidase
MPSGGAPGDDCSVGVWDGNSKNPLQLSGNTFAHDPTMIRVDDTYYRFWTGDYIPMATSTDLKNWSNAPSVYGGSYPAWVQSWLGGVPGQTFNFPWAPDVSSFGDEVHLYSSFSAKFGDNISCITHLSTSDISQGNWTDHGPVICTEGNENYNAIDADVGFDIHGKPYLAFGSFWDGIFAFELAPDGSRQGDELTRLAWANQIEAPVLFHRCGYHYLFVTWGLCCPGEGRSVNELTYRVAVGRSKDILGPYVDKEGTAMVMGGGTLIVQGDGTTWAAAGHSDLLVDGDKIYHLYHAYRQSDGGAALRIVELPFDEDGWPVPHSP